MRNVTTKVSNLSYISDVDGNGCCKIYVHRIEVGVVSFSIFVCGNFIR